MDVCTIIAKNYFAAARVLFDSLREHNPEARFHVLIVDDIEGYVDAAAEPFEVLGPDQLDLPRFEVMAGVYDVLELSTAVKPWLLRTLLDRSGDGVVYLDPDMRVYAPLDEVFGAVHEHGLVLNPHTTEPMPRDGRKPNEQDILIAGAYNLGFLGLGATEFSDFLLRWWSERLEMDCIVDPERGFFVDQRWIDLVPGLAHDFHLVRDPGFNVAYWNLATRKLAAPNGHLTVNDAPLRLFHFSGFKPDRPHLLSTHQDRIRLGDDPVLAQLCADYAQALADAGHPTSSKWPYTYASTVGGIPLNRTLRGLYRRGVEEGRLSGTPFDEAGERELLEYAREPAEAGGEHGVNRYLFELHAGRPDLRSVYPELDDPEVAAGFIGWVNAYGTRELDIPPALHSRVAPESPAETGPGRRPEGVNVAGYLNAELGVGEVARQVISALDAHGVPLLPIGLSAPNSRQEHGFAVARSADAPFDVNLICVNADGLPRFAADAGEEFFRDRHSVGIWWWELASFPEAWRGSFEHLDEIWAGSTFVADALSLVSPIPVIPMPLPLSIPAVTAAPDRRTLGLPEGFVFLFAFDYNSVFKRKNPLGLIEAFTRAFVSDEDVSLVIKSINHENDRDAHDRLRLAAAPHPHVHLMDRYLSAAEKNRLMASCDAFVSLHRSEGFGLGLAEALLLGRPVIATAYGGNTDFITPETGQLVPYTLVDVGDDAWPYPADAVWADPDLDRAAESMRELVADPAAGRARAERGNALLRERHSAVAAGTKMVERLRAIRTENAAAEQPEAPLTQGLPAPAPASLAARIRATAAAAPARGRLGPAGAVARKALLRALRPYSAHADAVALDLARGLERNDENLRAALARAERELALAQAQTLAEGRALRERLDALAAIRVPAARVGDEVRAADARIDDLASQVDWLRENQRAAAAELARLGARGPAVTVHGDAYPVAPDGEPWSEQYTAAHREFVARELDDAALLERFRAGEPLPERFGVGFDERVVEFPWLAAQRLGGKVLDAGSTLNHAHVLARLRTRMDELHIVTLAPEPESFNALGVSYLYADVRELPIADAVYDRVLSVSTLEHVGLDTTYYGGATAVAPDAGAELLRAVAELRRVLKPGGDLYLTVPAGAGERFEWVRSLDHAELDAVVDAFAPARSSITYFAYDQDGWRRSSRDATAVARYRDHLGGDPLSPDRLVAAQAVACLHLVKPA